VMDLHDIRQRQRREILKVARALARSGQHSDHSSIETALREIEGFEAAQRWFADWTFRAQLNTLCALAQDKWGTSQTEAA
jgi:hypothetical protein